MVNQADVRQLADALNADATRPDSTGGAPLVLDVREPFEFASGHVPGALSMPMHMVPLRLAELPTDSTIYVICAMGNRSWQVCHFLGQHGVSAINVTGGTVAWQSAGLPIESGDGSRSSAATAGMESAR